ncbi:MAG TPA: MOFRL family protein, partial [Anaerolineae bacterium]|nr:MOFRL family protein [Anaerolineae bacterium]
GEARMIGMELAHHALQAQSDYCLLAGGEPTVVLKGHGKGGRAQELVLSAAREIAGEQNIVVLSAGTDGTDGPTDAAGALADNTTLLRAEQRGLDVNAALEDNNAYPFFQALNDLLITRPTNTNVNDLMIVLKG